MSASSTWIYNSNRVCVPIRRAHTAKKISDEKFTIGILAAPEPEQEDDEGDHVGHVSG